MQPTFVQLFVDVISGYEVLLAPTFVVLLFALLDQEWGQFMNQRWQVRIAGWGRNLCLIGVGATLEFMVHHSELLRLTAENNIYPKVGGQLRLSVASMEPAAVLLILLLLLIPTGLIVAVQIVMRENIHALAATVCLFFGGMVVSLPLIIRYNYVGGAT
jgi:hypothetical protein